MKIKKSNLAPIIFFFAVSFVILLEGFRVRKHISAYDLLTPLRTDIYLQALGWMMALGAVLLLFSEVLRATNLKIEEPGIKIRDVALTVAIFTAYVFSAQRLGYSLSTVLFYFVFMRWVSRYSYAKSLVISVLVTICCNVIFIKAFQMNLPTGVIENLF